MRVNNSNTGLPRSSPSIDISMSKKRIIYSPARLGAVPHPHQWAASSLMSDGCGKCPPANYPTGAESHPLCLTKLHLSLTNEEISVVTAPAFPLLFLSAAANQ